MALKLADFFFGLFGLISVCGALIGLWSCLVIMTFLAPTLPIALLTFAFVALAACVVFPVTWLWGRAMMSLIRGEL